jgi:hypothetical protein
MRTWSGIQGEAKRLLRKLKTLVALDRFELVNIPRQGVYVFYEYKRPIYVGRSNRLKERILEHGRLSSRHNSAPFAFNIAKYQAKKLGVNIKQPRAKLEQDPRFKREFIKAKSRVSQMRVKILKVEDQVTQHVFEVYAAFHLKTTKYNFFGTH